MIRILKILPVVMLMLGTGVSYGQVIDFEGVVPPGEATEGFIEISPYFEDGFVLFGIEVENAIFSSSATDINSNGSDIFGWCGDCGPIIQIMLLRDNEDPFNLLSLEATDLLFTSESSGTPGDLNVEGFIAGGGSVGITLDLSAAWTTFVLPSTFTNLDTVVFSTTSAGVRSLGIDNIVVEAVPVPAAVWLFGSGLIGLIGIARRKKA